MRFNLGGDDDFFQPRDPERHVLARDTGIMESVEHHQWMMQDTLVIGARVGGDWGPWGGSRGLGHHVSIHATTLHSAASRVGVGVGVSVDVGISIPIRAGIDLAIVDATRVVLLGRIRRRRHVPIQTVLSPKYKHERTWISGAENWFSKVRGRV